MKGLTSILLIVFLVVKIVTPFIDSLGIWVGIVSSILLIIALIGIVKDTKIASSLAIVLALFGIIATIFSFGIYGVYNLILDIGILVLAIIEISNFNLKVF